MSPSLEVRVCMKNTEATQRQELEVLSTQIIQLEQQMQVLVVLGSINCDIVFKVDTICKEGETICAHEMKIYPGGKGLNQAIAARKAGFSSVKFIGAIGCDGIWLRELLEKEGVGIANVKLLESEKTGQALIQVSSKGENAIVLYSGANQLVPTEILQEIFETTPSDSTILLLQNEINLDAAAEATKLAKEKDWIVCLNPAPCNAPLFRQVDLLNRVDLFVLNEIEILQAFKLISQKSVDIEMNESNLLDLILMASKELISALSSLRLVITTIGDKGAIAFNRQGQYSHQKVRRKVDVIDTCGAGDCFVGYFLSKVKKLADLDNLIYIETVLAHSILASGCACETQGAMTSIPNLDVINTLISEQQLWKQ